MTAALADIISDLRDWESRARRLSTQIVPMLRRGTAVNAGVFNSAGGYVDAVDAHLPPDVSAPLHRLSTMLGDCISIAGRATFDLIAALDQRPELLSPPPLPDVPIAAAEERPVKARRR
jgi:hypothetical protein